MTQTVLVADDSQTIRRIVEMALKGSPYEIVGVARAGEVLRAAQRNPAIILLDYYMPDGSGYEVCRALKSNAATSHIPVVMLGGSYKNFDESMARQVGADEVVIKPFKTDQLLGAIDAAASAARASQGAPSVPGPMTPNPFGGGGGAPATPQPAFASQPSGFDEAPSFNNQPLGNPNQSNPPRIPSPPANQPRIPSPPGLSPNQRPQPTPVPQPNPDVNASVRQPTGPQPAGGGASGAAGAQALNAIPRPELERLVREEVKQIVREELPNMLRTIMGEVFQQKLMPKLMQHGSSAVDQAINTQLQRRIQEMVRHEIEALLSED